MARTVKQLKARKEVLTAKNVKLSAEVDLNNKEIDSLNLDLVAKVAELQAEIDAISETPTNTTEEVI